MDVYYYCSYTGSPVGFILGKLSNAHGTEERLELSEKQIEPLIRNCFELGMVRGACGLLPEKPGCYFLLFKKLVTRGSQDGLEYYLNIAFVTEDQQQYLQWVDVDEKVTVATVAQAVCETILINRESDFGYEVNGKSLKALTKMKFGSLLGKCKNVVREDVTYFGLASRNADTDEVVQALGKSNKEWELKLIFEGKDINWARLKKKSIWDKIPMWIRLLIMAALITALIALFVGVGKKLMG